MTSPNATTTPAIPSELRLPLGLLSSYLFFLLRRPISASNTHYLQRRLAGLQSLIPLFATSATPQSQRILCGLQRLRPAAFAPTARQLELDLFLAGQQVEIPQDFVVSSLPPNPPPFRSVRSIVIVTGPAIGIGDEIILFPLPAWIKAAHPNLEVTVVSGYRGLWDRVNGVDHLCHYSTHKELLEILRGPAHAVLLADFEKPGLAPLIASEPGSGAYIELSLGAQHCIVVDRQSRRIWTSSLPLEAGINYYEAFARLVEWLGVPSGRPARYAGVVRHDVRRTNEPLRILASPFTSKYDPSLMYWSNLLANLFPEGGSAAVEFVIDPGASLATARFAEALQRSATARSASNVKYAIAGDSRTLGLADFLGELERAHAVVCADSFAAHASPQFGCTTIVIAKPGLENWRTPSSQSFYFDVERPVKELLAGMRAVLPRRFTNLLFPSPARPPTSTSARGNLPPHSKRERALRP